MNRVFLKGNLGSDPKVHAHAKGKMAFLRVATNNNWSKDGKKHQTTQWHDIVIFKPQAVSFVESHLKAGDSVLIEGELQHRDVVNQNGIKARVSEVVISQGSGKITSLGLRAQEVNLNLPLSDSIRDLGAGLSS